MATALVLDPSNLPTVVGLHRYTGELHGHRSFASPPTRKRGEKYDEKSSRLEVEQEVTHQISSWVPIIITGKTDLA